MQIIGDAIAPRTPNFNVARIKGGGCRIADILPVNIEIRGRGVAAQDPVKLKDVDLSAVMFSLTGNIYATDRPASKATSDVDRLVIVCPDDFAEKRAKLVKLV